MKIDKNPSIGSHIVPFGWMDNLTDMTNLIVALYSVVNASENDVCLNVEWLWIKCIKDQNGRQYIKR
jgi:hypothetical protein